MAGYGREDKVEDMKERRAGVEERDERGHAFTHFGWV